MLKRIFFAGGLLFLAIMLSACGNGGETVKQDFNYSEREVKNFVKGWKIYTNPAFRFEIRYPVDWQVSDSGENGLRVDFSPLDSENEQAYLAIKSHINWDTNYSLAEFYANQENNLWRDEVIRQEVEIGDSPAYWFLGAGDEGEDILALDKEDRIIEFIIKEEFETARKIINSLKFYPDKVIQPE